MSVELWDRPEKLRFLLDRGLTEDTILDASLGYMPSGRFSDSIAIPYYDARGELVTVRFRRLDKAAPHKYDQIKGSKRHLYNVKNTDSPVVAIAEGEFDSLILGQMGVSAVSVPGAASWSRSWRWLFRNCDLVYVFVDSDEAGRKAGNKISGSVGTVADISVVHLPFGDVTDVYLKDPDFLKRVIS
jgi:DNA primase